MNDIKTCFRCKKRFIPQEDRDRAFCVGCTQEDLTIGWLAFGKTYLPKPVFAGTDAEVPDAEPQSDPG